MNHFLRTVMQGRRHGVDWGGDVHPIFLRIYFLIRLISINRDGGGVIFPCRRSVIVSPCLNFDDKPNHMGFYLLAL